MIGRQERVGSTKGGLVVLPGQTGSAQAASEDGGSGPAELSMQKYVPDQRASEGVD